MTIQRLGILILRALLLAVLPRADCGYGDRDGLCSVG